MPELQEREIKLLDLLVSGESNKGAANKLGIALRTMELHRHKVMQKLGAKSAAQLGYLYAQRKRQAATPDHSVVETPRVPAPEAHTSDAPTPAWG